uniref:Integrase catalytic domain-containing protein n=1 Tax=Plectus sambesii TaxID=2011161 RepID=A0A914WLI0_9BILA
MASEKAASVAGVSDGVQVGGADEADMSTIVSHEVDVVSEQSSKVFISGRALSSGVTTAKRRGAPTVAGSVRKGVKGRHRSWSAVPDGRYDAVLECLRDNKRPDPKHPHYKQIHRLVLLGKGKLAAMMRFDAALGTEDWRLVDKQSDRFVPRVSEIDTILSFFYENNDHPGARTLTNLSNRHYCGIGKSHADAFLADKDKAQRRHAVLFRKTPQLLAKRPMEHVQIDLLDMTEVAYGAKTYGFMVTVQCMFSRFMFARALSCKDRGLITRHLMDIFSTFGPPEAYQTYTGTGAVDMSMSDIAGLFGIPIHCYGRSGLNSLTANDQYNLRRKCYDKSQTMFGDELHWVEVLPLVVMERNMKAQQSFSYKISPFEVMYARQPWPSVESSVPPWLRSSWDSALGRSSNIEEGEQDEDSINGGEEVLDVEETDADAEADVGEDLSAYQDRGLGDVGGEEVLDVEETDADAEADVGEDLSAYQDRGLGEEDTYWKRSLCLLKLRSHRDSQAMARRTAIALNENRGLGSAKFPVKFLAGDDVYVRLASEVACGFATKRFARGTVIQVAEESEWPYRVRLHDFVMTDGSPREEWVGEVDVTAVTKQTEWVRQSGVADGKPDHLCQCDDEQCRRVKSAQCAFRMHRFCCHNADNRCAVHNKRAYPVSRSRKYGKRKTAVKSMSDGSQRQTPQAHTSLQTRSMRARNETVTIVDVIGDEDTALDDSDLSANDRGAAGSVDPDEKADANSDRLEQSINAVAMPINGGQRGDFRASISLRSPIDYV